MRVQGSGDGRRWSTRTERTGMLGAAERVALAELDERYSELRLSRPGVVAVLRRSLERDGLLRPLLINLERDGKLAVVDGLKRLRALRDLGREHALCQIMHLDAAAVRTAIVIYNAPHRGLCELEQAWVVRSLVRGCRLQQRQVAGLLGHHPSWVCRRLALAERLEETLQQDMRLGLVSATMARELSRLPRGNQTRVALAARAQGLNCQQCAALVERALGCHQEAELKALLADPWRYAVAAREPQEPAPDPRLGPTAEQLRQPLLRLERSAQRLLQQLAAYSPSSLTAPERELLAVVASSAAERCRAATGRIDELLQLSEEQ